VCLLKPATIDQISRLIVAQGHQLQPEAVRQVRADSFVCETNIHYPTESSLIVDGLRVVIRLSVKLSERLQLPGWRQHDHLLKKVQKMARDISRASRCHNSQGKDRLKKLYRELLEQARLILNRAAELCRQVEGKGDPLALANVQEIREFMRRTEQVLATARRRVLEGEKVPNSEKLFSIHEPHTQLYKRGKAGQPVQFGRQVLLFEDRAGFILNHLIIPRDQAESDIIVSQTRTVQSEYDGKIEELSLDRGFHSPVNQTELGKIVPRLCLPKKGAKQSAAQASAADATFHESRRRHPGVESAIGALQSGNGLERCRDHSELGYERYVSLGLLGRNIQTLGKLLIACQAPKSRAAHTKRDAA
jgi:hypothetical protein